MMKKIEYGKNSILVDAGDFSGQRSYRQAKVSELMFQLFGKMKYTAIELGEQELYLTLPELEKMSKDNNVPIICANLIDSKTGKIVFNEYIIKTFKKGGLFSKKTRVGIIGVIDDLFSKLLPKLKESNLSILPPDQVLDKLIPLLKDKEKADIIILLSHTTYLKTKNISEKYPQINIIIAAHEGNIPKSKEYKPNETILLKESIKGTSLSWLQLYLDKKGKISKTEGNNVELKLELPERS